MKNKIIAAAVVIAFASIALSACTKDVTEPETTTTTTTTEAVTQESSTTTSTTTSTTEFTTEITKNEVDSMETLLSLIKDFQSGTAGSSNKLFSLAIRFLNFTEDLDESKGALKDANYYLQTLSSEELDSYNENLAELDFIARKIIGDTTGSYAERIKESGEPYNEDGYSLEKYEKIYNFIADWTND